MIVLNPRCEICLKNNSLSILEWLCQENCSLMIIRIKTVTWEPQCLLRFTQCLCHFWFGYHSKDPNKSAKQNSKIGGRVGLLGVEVFAKNRLSKPSLSGVRAGAKLGKMWFKAFSLATSESYRWNEVIVIEIRKSTVASKGNTSISTALVSPWLYEISLCVNH